jgi:hypothetical protein
MSGVQTGLGATAFTRTPFFAASLDKPFTKFAIAVQGMNDSVVSRQLVWARGEAPWIAVVTIHLFEESLAGRIRIHTALAWEGRFQNCGRQVPGATQEEWGRRAFDTVASRGTQELAA